MSSKILSQLPILKSYEKLWPAFVQNKPSGLCIKEGIKTSLATIVPLRIIGVPRTFPKGQISPPITIEAHQGTHHIITTLNTTRQMHHDGCKTQSSQWTSVVREPPTVDEEEEETLEGGGPNMANTTINPPTASRIMPQTQGTRQMPVFNADKRDTMPGNALKGNNTHRTIG